MPIALKLLSDGFSYFLNSGIFEYKKFIVKTFKTIRTCRTMMFAELEKVMDYSIDGDSYLDSLGMNIFNKKSADGIKQSISSGEWIGARTLTDRHAVR